MPRTQEGSEGVYDFVLQDPRDMARATLHEAQSPGMQASILRHNVYWRSLCDRAAAGSPSEPSAQRTGEHDSPQGGERAAYVALDTSSTEGMRDRPPRREAQGDGAAVVLSARESRVQGEGRQVSVARGQGGRRDAERHNCLWTSRATGSQALERRIRRKVYVRCGEGPTEKERATATSPAAYSTHTACQAILNVGGYVPR